MKYFIQQNKNRYSVVLLLMLMFSSCEDDSPVIYFKNESDSPVACYVADGLQSGFSYPNVSLPSTFSVFCINEYIENEDWIWRSSSGSGFHGLVANTQQGVLSIYVFDQKTLDHDGWRAVFANNNYLVRYDLTETDLRLLKVSWMEKTMLSFPPSESMKNIAMYPPYEEISQRL